MWAQVTEYVGASDCKHVGASDREHVGASDGATVCLKVHASIWLSAVLNTCGPGLICTFVSCGACESGLLPSIGLVSLVS